MTKATCKRIKVLMLGFPREGDSSTGGVIVDRRYCEILEKRSDLELEISSFDEVGFERKVSKPSAQKTIIERLSKYDAVMFDARAFPKFISTIANIRAKCDVRIFAVMHHFYSLEKSGPKKLFIRILENYVYSRLDGMIFSGMYPYDLAGSMTALKNIDLRWIGIGFEQGSLVTREPSSNDNILFIGHVIARKGPQYLVKALRMLAEKDGIKPRTRIVGTTERDPRFSRKLKRMITRYGLENTVEITGRVSDDEMKAILKDSGIFVFPSLCEGFGMVVLETERYGMPAIVCNNTGLPYLVKDGCNGYLVDNGDWASIYSNLRKLIVDEEVYAQLSKGAYTSYEHSRSWQDIEDNLNRWVDEVLASKTAKNLETI